MRRLTTLIIALFIGFNLTAQDTFSIIAVDPDTGEVGSAGATCVFNIASLADVITKMIPGKGGVNSQAWVCIPNVNLENAIEQMELGLSPEEIIEWLLNNDACNAQGFDPEYRQYGIADLDEEGLPRTAGWTGSLADDYKEDRQGATYSVQGNILLDQSIIDGMEDNFNNTVGTLADKLMAALQGANVAGADARCLPQGTSSAIAYLRVYGPDDDPEDPMIDLEARPDIGVEPIDVLQDLYDDYLSVNDLQLRNAISMYPNPVQNLLNISTTDGLQINGLLIFDLSGKQVLSVDQTATQLAVDLSSLNSGLYLLQIQTSKGLITQQIVKN